MKYNIHIIIIIMILFLPFTICFAQKHGHTPINNIKENKIVQKEGLIWYDYRRIMRANFDEDFKSKKFNEPQKIAMEYLGLKHEILGINKNLKGIKLINSLKSGHRENFYYKQYYDNIPIYETEIILTVDSSNTVTYLLNNSKNIQYVKKIYSTAKIGKKEALDVALHNLGYANNDLKYEISQKYAEIENKGLVLCWKLEFERWIFLIDAVDVFI